MQHQSDTFSFSVHDTCVMYSYSLYIFDFTYFSYSLFFCAFSFHIFFISSLFIIDFLLPSSFFLNNFCFFFNNFFFFAAERKTSLGKDWHAGCLRCEKCNKTLTPGSHAEHEGKPYCHNPCYSALYGPGGNFN